MKDEEILEGNKLISEFMLDEKRDYIYHPEGSVGGWVLRGSETQIE